MDADERRALEEELAAELAALVDNDDSAGDGSFGRGVVNERGDAHSEPAAEEIWPSDAYVRLDLEQLLLEVAAQSEPNQSQSVETPSAGAVIGAQAGGLSSWNLLLVSVEKSDADFFQFIRQDLHDIQATILSVNPPAGSDVAARGHPDQNDLDDREGSQSVGVVQFPSAATTETRDEVADASSDLTSNSSEEDGAVKSEPKTATGLGTGSPDTRHCRLQGGEHHEHEDPRPLSCASAVVNEGSRKRLGASTLTKSSSKATRVPPGATPSDSQRCETHPDASRIQMTLDNEAQEQLKLIEQQHLARQRRLYRVQQARQQEHEKFAQQLREMEDQIAVQEAEQSRRQRERQEAKECAFMQSEERLVRSWLAAATQAGERERMAEEDLVSRRQHNYERAEASRAFQEHAAMALEEALAWKWIRLEGERQRKERLMEEKCVLRRRFNAVMFQLTANHEAKVVERKKQQDAERRREARESALMRSEELSLRRVLAQQRAFSEDQARTSERRAMASEDAASQAWVHALHHQRMHEQMLMEREDRLAAEVYSADLKRTLDENCLRMAKEEELSRRVQVLELQRRRMHVAGAEACRRVLQHHKRAAYLELALYKWKAVVTQLRQEELEAHRAARSIQRCCRRQRERRRGRLRRTNMAYAEEATAAAMVVQSTFRGFSIRRKFANALEMAKLVEGDDLEFGEVNLDDLIEMPPELEDGWENPVLPSSRLTCSRTDVSPEVDVEDESRDDSGQDCGAEHDEEAEQPRQEHSAAGSQRTAECSRQASSRERPRTEKSSVVGAVAAQPPLDATDERRDHPQQQPSANFSSTLWDKMRRMKNKQRHAAEERAREQDPTYRLQKLLKQSNKQQTGAASRPSSNQAAITTASTTGAPTVMWGSGNSEKKKLKVKLPSLVERLRKKTEAAR